MDEVIRVLQDRLKVLRAEEARRKVDVNYYTKELNRIQQEADEVHTALRSLLNMNGK